MFIKLRKQYSPELDSPSGGGNISTSTITEESKEGEGSNNGSEGGEGNSGNGEELENKGGAGGSGENQDNQQQGEGKQNEQQEEKSIFMEAAELAGLEIPEDFEMPDDVNGIVKLVQLGQEVASTAAVEREWQELNAKAAAGVELTKWQLNNPGRDEKEFYAAKLGTPAIDPTTLDKDNTELHRDILYKDFLNKGFPERMAKQYAQNAVDANTSFEDAQEILKLNAEREATAKAEKEVADRIESKKRYDAFVADIKARETNVRTVGKLGNVVIPVAQREKFIEQNYYDAGNPEYPNMSAIDIKLATMSTEQKDLYRYLVMMDLDVSKLVLARDTTRKVSELLGKSGATGSRMNGGTNRTGDSGADKRLDSPGQ